MGVKGDRNKNKWNETMVARHFSEASHNVCELCWQIVEEVYGTDTTQITRRLLQREAFWSFTLDSVTLKWLNEESNWNAFV